MKWTHCVYTSVYTFLRRVNFILAFFQEEIASLLNAGKLVNICLVKKIFPYFNPWSKCIRRVSINVTPLNYDLVCPVHQPVSPSAYVYILLVGLVRIKLLVIMIFGMLISNCNILFFKKSPLDHIWAKNIQNDPKWRFFIKCCHKFFSKMI